MSGDLSAKLSPLTIELRGNESNRYKSIDHVLWENIPPFAVLTGLNGSGKTQFLEALAYKLAGIEIPNNPALNAMELKVVGDKIGPDAYAFLPSAESVLRVQAASISQLPNLKQEFLNRLTPQNVANNIEAHIMRERIQQKFGVSIGPRPDAELLQSLPDDFVYMLEYNDVSAALSYVFVGYQIRRAEQLMAGNTEAEILAALGKPPWEFVNEALKTTEFPYVVVPPENRLLKQYHVQLSVPGSTTLLQLNDLSSGEKAIFRTMLWFYNTKHNNMFPKLFLLDEPDAHLHPSMTRQFLDVLKNVLVDQYGVRIIMTTHSPSTVALAPHDAIFVMAREQPRITRPTSRDAAIGLLTAGLVIVSPGTRFVFVEDEADVRFYSAVRDILSDQGPNKDPRALKPAPSIIFLPASLGRGTAKIPGGRQAVLQWIDRLDAPPLDQLFHGIIDLDEGNAATTRISVLARHSLENYLLDPLVVFGALIDDGVQLPIQGVSVTAGDEARLRLLPVSDLQAVVDAIRAKIEPALLPLTADDCGSRSVTFTTHKTVSYAGWMLDRRGHDLLPVYQSVFGQNIITPPKLLKSFRRLRLLPLELAEILERIQNT